MLAAVGIASAVVFDGSEFQLLVDAAGVSQALSHLRQYDLEIASALSSPLPPPLRLHPNAWVGSLVYVLVLLGVAYAISNGLWRLDAFDTGDLDGARVRSGQWWRAWTALTLHLDGPHLAANTGAGVWFGYLAARLIGSGNSWLLIVVGAGLANWIEGRFGPAAHRAVGASTAVFAALGLLSAYSWSTRFSYPQRWALRWGPLVAGVVLLGWTGTEGEGTDVVAHGLGFAVGALFGAAATLRPVRRVLDQVPQWLAGLAALTPIAVAWIYALRS
jgi:membrane associated rhomboid family serine protease